MKIRLNDKKDDKKIRALWEAVFPEDSKEYLDFYFDVVMQENQVIVVEHIENESTDIVGMLHLNPYNIYHKEENLKINYIVAVATKEKFRRQGLMRKMLNYAEVLSKEQGINYLLLMPADERYYNPFGYNFASKQYNTTIYTENYLDVCNEDEQIPKKPKELAYNAFEHHFITKHFEDEDFFSPIKTSELAYRIYHETLSENGKIYEFEGNLILMYEYVENENKKIEIRKIYYNKESDDLHMNYERIMQFLVCFAQGSPILIHEVEQRRVTSCFQYNRKNNYDCRPYMMIKSLLEDKKFIHHIYFDEMV